MATTADIVIFLMVSVPTLLMWFGVRIIRDGEAEARKRRFIETWEDWS